MGENMWVNYSEFGVGRKFNDLEKELFNTIPHGSGIDHTWEIQKMKSYYKCDCSYHVMNSDGFYIGWSDFSIIIPFKKPEEFRLHFHGSRSQHLNRYYMLRDYMEELFYYWISEDKKDSIDWNVFKTNEIWKNSKYEYAT